MPKNRLRTTITTLAGQHVKFVSATQLCSSLDLSEEECLRILQELAAEGLLRVTRSEKGEYYFWLTPCNGNN